MNQTFLKTLAVIIIFTISIRVSDAANYTAIKSGNFSDTATWHGNVVPPTIVDTNIIRVLGGVTVTLDRNIFVTTPFSEIAFLYTGGPNGKIISTSGNYIVVDSGRITGIGMIDIDSMYISQPRFTMSGILNLNKLTLNETEFDPIYSISINLHKELRLAGGDNKIQRSAAVVTLDTNADIVYAGGILGVGPNSLNVNKGYNVRYTKISYVHYSIKNINTLNELEVAVGAGNTVRMTADVLVPKKLLLTSGSLKTDGYVLTMGPLSTIEPGGTGGITGTASTKVIVQSTYPQFGIIRFSGSIGNFKIETNTNVQLGTDLFISNSLELQQGMLQTDGNDVVLSATATLSGGSGTSYIMTNNGGQLKQHIPASGNKFYPVGALQHYAPVTIGNNTTAAYADLGISASDTVFSYGTYGYNMLTHEPLVNSSWTVSGNSSNIDFSIEPQWNNLNEINGFNSAACFVSQYINGVWDNAPYAVATNMGAMKTVKKASANNFGSFAVAGTGAFASVNNNQQAAGGIKLYPNPAFENINISYPGNGFSTATISDITGRAVKSFSVHPGINTISISEFTKGIYLLKLQDGTNMNFVKD